MKQDKISRRNVVRGVGAAGAASIFGTGIVSAGNNDDDFDPETVEWEGHGDEHADQSDCGEAHWHWVLTPGGSDAPVVNDDFPWLEVVFEDGHVETALGYRNGYGTNGAVHFDIFHEGDVVESATAYLDGGGSERSILTISDGGCELLPFWQIDLIHGEPIEDFGDGCDDPARTSYTMENRLLQALWYPGDPGDLEEFLDDNDDEYAHCDVSIETDITYHSETETATATIHIGNAEDCGPNDFNLVSHDSEENSWEADCGAGQVLHDTGDFEMVGEDTYTYTVDVPN